MKILLETYEKYIPLFIRIRMSFLFRLFLPKKHRFIPSQAEREYSEHLIKSKYLSNGELKELQFRKFKKLIAHAYENVPYYSKVMNELGLKPEDFKTLSDIEKLPILTKNDIFENYCDFLSKVHDSKDLKEFATGGSTGAPLKFKFDDHTIGVQRAHWQRWSSFAGIDLYKDKMLYIGGASNKELKESQRPSLNLNGTIMIVNADIINDINIDQIIKDILTFKPEYIRGYASSVYLLAEYINNKEINLAFKAILVSSDTLFTHFRIGIEKAFSCKVFDFYGQNEDAITATECNLHDGYHLNMESCIAEVLNESGVPVINKMGSLIGTHLENYAFPLIRYVVGDNGIISDKDCNCGLGHTMISELHGRGGDVITTKEGKKLGGGIMSLTTKSLFGKMGNCQFVQHKENELEILLVPTKLWKEEDAHYLIDKTKDIIGDGIAVQITLVENIPTRNNGKFQFIKSLV